MSLEGKKKYILIEQEISLTINLTTMKPTFSKTLLLVTIIISSISINAQKFHRPLCSSKTFLPAPEKESANDAHVVRCVNSTIGNTLLNSLDIYRVDKIIEKRLALRKELRTLKDIEKVVPKIIEGFTTDLEKARAIYSFMNFNHYSYHSDMTLKVLDSLGIHFQLRNQCIQKVNVNIFDRNESTIDFNLIGYEDQKKYDTLREETKEAIRLHLFLRGSGGSCHDFSKVYALMAQQAGLKCVYVNGYWVLGNTWEPHAWNYIEIENIKFYIDLTNEKFITTNHEKYALYIPYNVYKDEAKMTRSVNVFGNHLAQQKGNIVNVKYTLDALKYMNSAILQDYTLLEQPIGFMIVEYRPLRFDVYRHNNKYKHEQGVANAR